jgi:hypothetical protein
MLQYELNLVVKTPVTFCSSLKKNFATLHLGSEQGPDPHSSGRPHPKHLLYPIVLPGEDAGGYLPPVLKGEDDLGLAQHIVQHPNNILVLNQHCYLFVFYIPVYCNFTPELRIRIRDPVHFYPKDPGSG